MFLKKNSNLQFYNMENYNWKFFKSMAVFFYLRKNNLYIISNLQDESRLKTVTMNASTIDFKEQSQRLIEEIKKLQMWIRLPFNSASYVAIRIGWRCIYFVKLQFYSSTPRWNCKTLKTIVYRCTFDNLITLRPEADIEMRFSFFQACKIIVWDHV